VVAALIFEHDGVVMREDPDDRDSISARLRFAPGGVRAV